MEKFTWKNCMICCRILCMTLRSTWANAACILRAKTCAKRHFGYIPAGRGPTRNTTSYRKTLPKCR